MYIYMCVTKDKYELPVAVADSPAELGRLLGVNSTKINSTISQAKRYGWNSPYKKVEIEEGEDYE